MKTTKTLCILLAVLMLVSLCACGGNASSVSGNKTEAPNVTDSQPLNENETEAEVEADEDFSVGATLENTYENEYFGIGVTLDDNWAFATQEEINKSNGMVNDAIDNDFLAEALENGTVYTDMSANGNDGLLNINTTIEKLNIKAALAIDEEQYVDIALENYDYKAILGEMGLDVTSVEKGTVTVIGEEHPCITIVGTVEGVDFYEKVATIKKGTYVLSVTASSIGDDTVDELLASFYAL